MKRKGVMEQRLLKPTKDDDDDDWFQPIIHPPSSVDVHDIRPILYGANDRPLVRRIGF